MLASRRTRKRRCLMAHKQRVTVRIPDPEDLADDGPPRVYIPVQSEVVTNGVDLLQAFITQWKMEDGCEPDDEVWDALAVAAAQMLSGLMRDWAAYYRGDP